MDPKLRQARVNSGVVSAVKVPPLAIGVHVGAGREQGFCDSTKSWDIYMKEQDARDAARQGHQVKVVPVEMWWPWWDLRHGMPKTERKRPVENPENTMSHLGKGSYTVREMHPDSGAGSLSGGAYQQHGVCAMQPAAGKAVWSAWEEIEREKEKERKLLQNEGDANMTSTQQRYGSGVPGAVLAPPKGPRLRVPRPPAKRGHGARRFEKWASMTRDRPMRPRDFDPIGIEAMRVAIFEEHDAFSQTRWNPGRRQNMARKACVPRGKLERVINARHMKMKTLL